MHNIMPLYPEHGQLYDLAMMEAHVEYQHWLLSRRQHKGVTIYAVRSNQLEKE